MGDAPRLSDESEWWLEDDTLSAAKALLRDYDAGKSVEVRGEGWLVRFASALVRAQQSEGAQAKVVEGWPSKKELHRAAYLLDRDGKREQAISLLLKCAALSPTPADGGEDT